MVMGRINSSIVKFFSLLNLIQSLNKNDLMCNNKSIELQKQYLIVFNRTKIRYIAHT